jgi:hypothetical protein
MTPDDLQQRLSDAVLMKAWGDAVLVVEQPGDVRVNGAEAMRRVILAALAAPAPVRTPRCSACRYWEPHWGDDSGDWGICARKVEMHRGFTHDAFGCSLWQPTPQEEA